MDARVIPVSMRPVLEGEPISLPVVESDGSRSGHRLCAAPGDGFEVDAGDYNIFLPASIVRLELRELDTIAREWRRCAERKARRKGK